jgi:hypothetical protein
MSCDSVTLLLGMTGAGKSTLITYLANYILGGTPDNPHVPIATKHRAKTGGSAYSTESNASDQSQSQTLQPQQYIVGNLVLVDTPGLADTRGITQDYANINAILEYIKNFASVARIVLVINGTTARATGPARIVSRLLCSSIPRSALENLVIVFTNCSYQAELSFDVEQFCATMGVSASDIPIFYMQNSGFATAHAASQRSWSESMDNMRALVNVISDTVPIPTAEFLLIYDARRELQNAFASLLEQLEVLDDLERSNTVAGKAVNILKDRIAVLLQQIADCCRRLRAQCPNFNFAEELDLRLDFYSTAKANARTNDELRKYDALFAQLRPVVLQYAPSLEERYWPGPTPEELAAQAARDAEAARVAQAARDAEAARRAAEARAAEVARNADAARAAAAARAVEEARAADAARLAQAAREADAARLADATTRLIPPKPVTVYSVSQSLTHDEYPFYATLGLSALGCCCPLLWLVSIIYVCSSNRKASWVARANVALFVALIILAIIVGISA